MKKFFTIFVVALLVTLLLCSCQSNENTQSEIATDNIESTTVQSQSEEVLDIENLKENEFRISDLPGKITVSDSYNVYSLDNKYTDGRELYRDLGLVGYNKPKSIQELQALQDIYPEEMGKITEQMSLEQFQGDLASYPELIGNLLDGMGINSESFMQAYKKQKILLVNYSTQ